MKKSILFFFLLTVFCVANAQDEPKNFKNGLRMGVTPLIRGGFQLSYERISENYGIVFIGEITSYKVSGKDIQGQMGELQYRIFLSNSSSSYIDESDKNFLYVAPFLSYRTKTISQDNYDDRINSIGIGLIFGFDFTIWDRLTLDINLGGVFKNSDIETDRTNYDYTDNIFSPGYSGVLPAGNITFGIRF